ncbi:MAG: PDZ domain-containing protein [Planctomycetes bacterium]|nr:PDZ domain-containing protein [Planctomycetota bacterium]
MRRLLPCFLLPALLSFAQDHHRTENRALLGIVTGGTSETKILHVLPNSPAEKAGLKEGDLVTAIGTSKITLPADVDKALAPLEAKTKVKIIYVRAEKEATVEATLIERKAYKGDFLKVDRKEGVPWYAYAWANVPEGAEPPTWENTKGKIVVLHAFQSW